MKGSGRRIVVDADVGTSAADSRRAERGQAVDQRALAFTRCLNAMYDARHVAVFSPRLRKEWRDHVRPGSSGHRWLTRMVERRFVDLVKPEPDVAWLEDIIHNDLPPGDHGVALKDGHLVATAATEADT